MKKITKSIALAFLMILITVSTVALGEINSVTPSTNDANRDKDWAHVNEVSVGIGEIQLEFVSKRNFMSCFEFRSDGDTSQIISSNGGKNYNTNVTDGLYPFVCVNNNTAYRTLLANEYVEVRMVFGAETDERFDWTRFDVLAEPTPPVPTEIDQCKKGGWMSYFRSDASAFKNQGDCIQYVLTGK